MYRVFIGFDPREAVVFHACVNSLIRHSSRSLAITPLSLNNLQHDYTEDHGDGSNAFTYSRFLVPYLCDFEGQALYLDGDMIVRNDIIELFETPGDFDVAVVKHDYTTVSEKKYFSSVNPNYPRKNWSSVVLWNCQAKSNHVLTPEFVRKSPGSLLHRFQWTTDDRIHSLPFGWNWLVGEYPNNDHASLYHYTLGSPCFPEYADGPHSEDWWQEFYSLVHPIEGMDKGD